MLNPSVKGAAKGGACDETALNAMHVQFMPFAMNFVEMHGAKSDALNGAVIALTVLNGVAQTALTALNAALRDVQTGSNAAVETGLIGSIGALNGGWIASIGSAIMAEHLLVSAEVIGGLIDGQTAAMIA